MIKDIIFTHERDAAWIIALWLAIHGGDPAPDGVLHVDETSVLLATTLSHHLATTHRITPLEPEQLRARLADAGLTLSEPCSDAEVAEFQVAKKDLIVGGRCVRWGDEIYCVAPPEPHPHIV
jgi:hypothetical protein